MRMRLFHAATAVIIFLAVNFFLLPFTLAAGPQAPVMKMSSNISLFSSTANASTAAATANIQTELERFLVDRKPASLKKDWQIKSDGKIDFDKNIWTATKDDEGSEVFELKKPFGASEQKRTVIRNDDQSIRTISEYRLIDKKENYWFVFFLDQHLAAATTCTDKTADGLRNCITAIPSVCKSLPTSKAVDWTLPKAVVPDVDLVEKRALATVLSMRGEGHQMENMAKTGNLIGLKHKLQTTRGRLTAAPVKSEYIAETAALCARL